MVWWLVLVVGLTLTGVGIQDLVRVPAKKSIRNEPSADSWLKRFLSLKMLLVGVAAAMLGSSN
jgi:hypothetical protein